MSRVLQVAALHSLCRALILYDFQLARPPVSRAQQVAALHSLCRALILYDFQLARPPVSRAQQGQKKRRDSRCSQLSCSITYVMRYII